MACTPPASASEVFCRAAKCNRLMGRLLMVAAIVVTIILYKATTGYAQGGGADANTAQKVVGQLTAFATLLVLQLSLICLARRRCSAAHHAQVKSNNLKALELLAASATDEATKKDLLARSADLIAGKPGCCK